jgi:hypothetical protein
MSSMQTLQDNSAAMELGTSFKTQAYPKAEVWSSSPLDAPKPQGAGWRGWLTVLGAYVRITSTEFLLTTWYFQYRWCLLFATFG